MVKQTILFLFVALSSLAPALAQFDTSTVLGEISDPSERAISNAKVTIENINTGVRQTTATNESGSYLFGNLRVGSYRVMAESTGFKTASSDRFELVVNARQRVDLSLVVGSVSETVTVNDAVALLETETSSRGQIIGNQQIVNLPLNGRSCRPGAVVARRSQVRPRLRKSAPRRFVQYERHAQFAKQLHDGWR
jgi:Carboxypeptidase regulatory-like domain